MKSAIVFSGGLDSTVALHQCIANGTAHIAITMDYGQRHAYEVGVALQEAELFGVRCVKVDLKGYGALLKGSALTDRSVPVPDGHYEDESMKSTIVPNRNMVFLAIATSIAIANGCDEVVYGAHKGDNAVYPDCRPEFIGAMQCAIALCDAHKIHLRAPFANMTKADIVREGYRLGVDMSATFSCYHGTGIHCGTCGTCVERREAFQLAGVIDKTIYQCM